MRIQNYLCNIYQLANGGSQGIMLAVTLFAIKINRVAKFITPNGWFIFSLYVDNLQIKYRLANLQVIKEELQQCLSRMNR